jgi:Na+/glutamate symporter
MIRGGIIVLFAALVGWCLTNAIMLGNLLRRKPPGRIAFPEFLAVFFAGVIGKDYRALLEEAHVEPTRFDEILYILDKIFMWSLIGSTVLVIIGFAL